MKIGFVYNLQREFGQKEAEYDSPATVDGIELAIKKNGHQVIRIEADTNCFECLKKIKDKIELVFNIAEGVPGDARESQVPIFCEILKIPYTHSTPTVHAISLNKQWTKSILANEGIRIPKSIIINGEINSLKLNYPLILKPNNEGSSKGIFNDNIVDSYKKLKERIKTIRDQGDNGEIIAEEYIDGREFTVALLGNGDKIEVLPIVEQKFDFLPKGMHKIAGYELKWIYEDKLKDLSIAYDCPAILNSKQKKDIEDTSRQVFKILKVRDCARIDYRMDKSGNLYFIEINTLPGMIPNEKVISYFPLAARKAGLNYNQMVGKIIELAKSRQSL